MPGYLCSVQRMNERGIAEIMLEISPFENNLFSLNNSAIPE
jgi:hypothetical protein